MILGFTRIQIYKNTIKKYNGSSSSSEGDSEDWPHRASQKKWPARATINDIRGVPEFPRKNEKNENLFLKFLFKSYF